MGPTGADTIDVPFVDLQREQEELTADLSAAFARGVARGDYVLGEEVELFEEAFAEYVGTAHCVGVGSGTAALQISLVALGIGPGDEVIIPAHTFIASGLPVLHVGATPVFCDVDADRGLIDLEAAAAVVTDRTAAVIAVHLYGQSCDLAALRRFGAERGIAVVEDAAQAHGASWAAERAGSAGTISAFSFYPSKNLGALGDGGAICTADPVLAGQARKLRNLGQRIKGHHEVAGFNERLDTLQAAFLRAKLPYLDGWNESRRRAAALYSERLPGGLRPGPSPSEAFDVYHLFPIRHGDRDRLASALAESGIGTGIHYSPAVHRQPPFSAAAPGSYANAEAWAHEELSLPMFPGLSEREIDRVCEVLSGLV